MLAVDQLDAGGAEPVELIVPGGLAGMGGVDARKDDHGHGGCALAVHGECLVVGDAEGEFRDTVRGHRRPDENVTLGMWLRLVGSRGVDRTGRMAGGMSSGSTGTTVSVSELLMCPMYHGCRGSWVYRRLGAAP